MVKGMCMNDLLSVLTSWSNDGYEVMMQGVLDILGYVTWYLFLKIPLVVSRNWFWLRFFRAS